MSLSDPIGDMLARIKNSLMRNHKKVQLPSSRFKIKLAEVLKSEGYIIDFKVTESDFLKRFIISSFSNIYNLRIRQIYSKSSLIIFINNRLFKFIASIQKRELK